MKRRSSPGLAKRTLYGATAGTVSTLPMSLLMLGAQKMGLMGKQPPEKITEAALNEIMDEPVQEPVEDALSVVNHFAFGAVAGALYGGLRREEMSQIAQGMVFATGVWSGSYMGWVPALGIMPPATRDREGRPESMFVAHLVFGACLGALTQWLEER